MPLIGAALLLIAIGGGAEPPPPVGLQLAQSTHPSLTPPGRPGRSYAPPEQSNPGTSSGPLLAPPRMTPPNSQPSRDSLRPPTATDCAAGYSSRSGLTRREFNRLCGQGS